MAKTGLDRTVSEIKKEAINAFVDDEFLHIGKGTISKDGRIYISTSYKDYEAIVLVLARGK